MAIPKCRSQFFYCMNEMVALKKQQNAIESKRKIGGHMKR